LEFIIFARKKVGKGCSNFFSKGADVLFVVMLKEAEEGGGGKGVLCLVTGHFEAIKVLPIGSICEQMQSSSKTNENNFGKHLGTNSCGSTALRRET
jgi:hypothetical protein